MQASVTSPSQMACRTIFNNNGREIRRLRFTDNAVRLSTPWMSCLTQCVCVPNHVQIKHATAESQMRFISFHFQRFLTRKRARDYRVMQIRIRRLLQENKSAPSANARR